MGTCKCGFSTDPEKNCNGTHKIVAAVKADIIAKIEGIDPYGEANNQLNGIGMKMVILDMLKGKK